MLVNQKRKDYVKIKNLANYKITVLLETFYCAIVYFMRIAGERIKYGRNKNFKKKFTDKNTVLKWKLYMMKIRKNY